MTFHLEIELVVESLGRRARSVLSARRTKSRYRQLHIHIAWTSERSKIVRSQQPTMFNDCCAAHCKDSRF